MGMVDSVMPKQVQTFKTSLSNTVAACQGKRGDVERCSGVEVNLLLSVNTSLVVMQVYRHIITISKV